MGWQTDYFLCCDICQRIENIDGRTKAQATKTARAAGWLISRKQTICPKCHGELKSFHEAARQAEAERKMT
jgi:hypothetical protein